MDMPFIFKINVSWKKGDLKSTNISNIFNIFFISYRNLFALGFLYAILTENVGNNLKKNIGPCLGNPTTKNHFCHIRRAVCTLSTIQLLSIIIQLYTITLSEFGAAPPHGPWPAPS